MRRRWNVANSIQLSAVSNQCLTHRTRYLVLSTILLLAACTGDVTPTAVSLAPASMPKLLATVAISPTPDSAQRASTQNASTATVTTPPITSTPQATAYIGVFLGEVQPDEAGPNFNITPLAPLTLPTLDAPAANCTIPPDAALGTGWTAAPDVAAELGCPVEAAAPFEGTLQIFERGVMYFRPTGEIWAVSPGGGRYWYVTAAPPVQPGEIIAPEGLRAPVLGFGAVWRGVEGVEAALGFATTEEETARLTFQRFQGGALLGDRASGQVFILYADGTLAGPYA